MDIAVKDARSTETGWVFATYVYDESLPAANPADRWYNLTPVGLAWGNDPDVTAAGDPDLDENWINPAVPAPFAGMTGKHGRLNGPVDNPDSSCMSCHSTAQVRANLAGSDSFMPYKGVAFIPADTCSEQDKMNWFRNIDGSEPFGVTTQASGFCDLPAAAYPASAFIGLLPATPVGTGTESGAGASEPLHGRYSGRTSAGKQSLVTKTSGPIRSHVPRGYGKTQRPWQAGNNRTSAFRPAGLAATGHVPAAGKR